jgi:HK97 family phage major capsid protein
MLPKVTIIPMPVSKLTLPAVTAGYSAGWGTINTQVVDSKVTLDQVALSAEKLVALSLVPNELMEDSGLPIAPLLANEFAEAFAMKIDEEILSGDTGDGANHKFMGWGNVVGTIGYGPGTDASPTLAEEVTIDNLAAEIAAVEAANTQNMIGAEWFFAPEVWAVIRSLVAATTNLPQVAINEPWRFNLFGFPVNINHYVPHAETAAKTWGLFGNPKYIYFGDMMGMSVEASKEYRFADDQTTFLARQRCAVAVGIPGSLGCLKFGAAG